MLDAQTVRVNRCDVPQAEMVAQRAYALREAAGRLPEQRTKPVPVLLQQVASIQGERDVVPSSELLETLNSMPEYADAPFTFNSLGNQMRKMGHPSRKVAELGGRMGYSVKGPELVDNEFL